MSFVSPTLCSSLSYQGVLNDVKATEKSIAAGGVDSVKDSKTGVSDPYVSLPNFLNTFVLNRAWLMCLRGAASELVS